MRGKAITARRQPLGLRITPAHAGKSQSEPETNARRKDHPRTCGEKSDFLRLPDQGHGITPAHAGKSSVINQTCSFGQDHPRTCGEKKVMRGGKDKKMGSPPHMRGKVVHFFGAHLPAGITPAHAGKSGTLPGAWPHARDHPRTCGEKSAHSFMPMMA